MFKCKCIVCGETFVARKNNAIYCSPAHRQKAYRQRKGQPMSKKEAEKRLREARKQTARCPHCGKKFSIASRGKPARFDTPSCRTMYHRAKKQAAIVALAGETATSRTDAFFEVQKYGLETINRVLENYGLVYIHGERAYRTKEYMELSRWVDEQR